MGKLHDFVIDIKIEHLIFSDQQSKKELKTMMRDLTESKEVDMII